MEGLRDRTKQFALRVVRMYSALPKDTAAQVMGKQVLRSGTSVAANFREASRARSDAEFVSKLGIVEQELDETILWFELLMESDIVASSKLTPLKDEAEELIKIIVSSIKSTKAKDN
ncbi:MAG: four helix bundle protein [Planctomycetales bacterium]|nr:four helix bundle protein [Planctomycetales bacterium]